MPHVSVIVPCYNEQETICQLLEALYSQNYPLQEMEVVIADGQSTDNTLQEIDLFQRAHPELSLRVVDNPQRIIPVGLNQALAAAEGEIIIRLDAHSIPFNDYVQRCVDAIQAGLGDNVGGQWVIQAGSDEWQARSIAAAAAHPLGVGDARYRLGGRAQEVETVPFGAFQISLVDQVGNFNENLLTNEDYEFNARIRQSGGKIWFDPAIRSKYIARKSFYDLSKQYWRYGFWKARMLRRFPGELRWRQLAGAFVISFPLLALLGIWFPFARWLLGMEIVVYLLALIVTGVQLALQKRDVALLWGVPLAIATMHFSWGIAFILSLVSK